MNHDDFIKTAELSMECTALLARTDTERTDWPEGSGHYQFTIKRGEKTFTSYYSCGPGIIEQWACAKWGHKPLDFRSAPEVMKEARDLFRPELSDVLQSLQSDVMGLEDGDSFEHWASGYGYDEDSRKAERIYNACKRTMEELGNLFGAELYETFVTEVEED